MHLLKNVHLLKRSIPKRCHLGVVMQQTSYFSDQSVSDKKMGNSGGFADAFNQFSSINTQKSNEVLTNNASFKSLLKNSKFIDLGDPHSKFVIGTITHTVDNDLYIDFGWKFNCVCPRPEKNGNKYVRGSKVKLQIKELELSARFLGEEKDLTILEADCRLVGLALTSKSNEKHTETK